MKKAMSTVHPDEVYTEREAAELLGVSPRTVRRRIDGGELAATWRGNRWHIPGWSLIEYRDGSSPVSALRSAYRATGATEDDITLSKTKALLMRAAPHPVKEMEALRGLSGIGIDRLHSDGSRGYVYTVVFPASWVEAVVS